MPENTPAYARDLATYPHATVTEVREYRGTWILLATCPNGRPVAHGGGPVEGDPAMYLGHRGAHCTGLPATRRQPECHHGDYVLVPALGMDLPNARSAA